MDFQGIVLQQIIYFATILFIGFIASKTKYISDECVTQLQRFMMKIALPFFILAGVVNGGTRDGLIKMWPFAIEIFFMFILAICIGFITGKLLGLKKPELNSHICSVSFVNSALIAFPIITAVFPEKSGLYIAAYMIVETIMVWTAGVGILSSASGKAKISLKKMVSTTTIALIIGLVMVFADIHPENIVWDAVTGLGTLQKYVGLIYIGADIGRRGFKQLFEKPMVLLTVPIRLIIIPVVFFFILKATGLVSDEMILAGTIFAMIPTMLIISVLADEYKAAPDYSVATLIATTICCLFTMPIVFSFLAGFCSI